MNGYHVDAVPEGYLLVCSNRDRPGVISHISSVLAKSGINIAGMTVGRDRPGGRAVTVLNIDSPVQAALLKRIRSSRIILDAQVVKL